MTSKIIECRYATADIQTETSDYQCNLKYSKDLVMEEGDALQIKNTFIDTQQQSGGKIVVKATITAQMEYIKYFYKNQDAQYLPFGTYKKEGSDGNLTYQEMSQMFNTAGQMMFYCKNITQDGDPTEITSITNRAIGECLGNMTIKYTVPGETKQSSQTIPVQPGLFVTVNTNVGIIYDADKPITITNSDQGTTSAIGTTKKVIGYDYNLIPVIFQSQITIPAGNYEPTDLATEINRQIQSSNILNGEQGTQNAQPVVQPNPYVNASNFLTSERQSEDDIRYLMTLGDNGATDDGSSQIDLARLEILSLLLGASQMELAWDPDLNAFSWNYLHMPYYTEPVAPAAGVAGVPAQPAVGFIKSPYQTSDDPKSQFLYMSVTAQSGIVFTSLTSSYPDGSEANLWDGMLGFQLQANTSKGEDPANNLLVKVSRQRLVKTIEDLEGDTSPDDTIQMNVFSLDRIPAPGKQITTGFMGLNALLNKNQANWYQPNANLVGNFLSTTTDTNNILGRQILLSSTQNLYNFGYFLIALQAGFKSDFYDKESKENIMAIVSRYYEANSFTSGTSDDSVVYVHKGSPTTLSSIGVKILLPDKTLAQNIGTGSSIFVELIKNQSQ